jgi:hypothetical protein
MKCYELHGECGVSCTKKDCRYWIDYENDMNCTIIAIHKNGCKPMTLREVGERIGVSFVRVKQIEDKIVKKLAKKKHLVE